MLLKSIQKQTHMHNTIIPNLLYFSQPCCLNSFIPSMLVILKKFFAELGWFYRYESSSDCLHLVRLWRASDLLVWISTDTTCKTKWIVIIVVETVNTLLLKCVSSFKIWEIMTQFKYWIYFYSIRHSVLILFGRSRNYVLKYFKIYKVLIIRNFKITFKFYG